MKHEHRVQLVHEAFKREDFPWTEKLAAVAVAALEPELIASEQLRKHWYGRFRELGDEFVASTATIAALRADKARMVALLENAEAVMETVKHYGWKENKHEPIRRTIAVAINLAKCDRHDALAAAGDELTGCAADHIYGQFTAQRISEVADKPLPPPKPDLATLTARAVLPMLVAVIDHSLLDYPALIAHRDAIQAALGDGTISLERQVWWMRQLMLALPLDNFDDGPVARAVLATLEDVARMRADRTTEMWNRMKPGVLYRMGDDGYPVEVPK